MSLLTLGRRSSKGVPSGELLLANLANRGTPANTTEVNLADFWLGPSLLGVGEGLRLRTVFRTAANANTKRARVLLGTTVLFDTTALAANGEVWVFEIGLLRTGSATQVAWSTGFRGATPLAANEVGATENMDLPRQIRVTGQNGTGTLNDLVLRAVQLERLG
jgi:hypothetical protein